MRRLNGRFRVRGASGWVATLIMLLCWQAGAQVSQVNGTINGVITDPSASPVPNAAVVANIRCLCCR